MFNLDWLYGRPSASWLNNSLITKVAGTAALSALIIGCAAGAASDPVVTPIPPTPPIVQAPAPITTVDPTTLYNSFENNGDLALLGTTNATIALNSDPRYISQGSSSLKVTMTGGQSFPGFRYNFPTPYLNWAAYSGAVIDVYNPGLSSVTLYSRIDDSTDTLTGSVTIPAQSSASTVFAFSAPYAPSVGMKAGPLLPGYAVMANSGAHIAATGVTDLLFYSPTTGGPGLTLYFDNLRLINGYSGMSGQQSAVRLLYTSMIDKYGQFTKASWPEKVYVDADLNGDAPLSAPPTDRDLYGGASALVGYGTTGYFHTTKLANGNWWFVDPAGSLFFSLGVDSVGSPPQNGSSNPSDDVNQTFVGVDNNVSPAPDARYSWFTSLPASSDALAIDYGANFIEGTYCDQNTNSVGCTFDFSSANLQRKFGTPAFVRPWQTETLTRLHAWGFNTLGDFSDIGFAQAADLSGNRIPYTIKVGFNRSSYLSVTLPLSGNPQIADPYDTKFASAIFKGVSDTITSSTVNDSWLLGYFLDNEMPWSNGTFFAGADAGGADDANYFPLVYGVLESSSVQPSKVYWEQSVLIPQYVTVSNLNASWGTKYSTWSDFLTTTSLPAMNAATRADFSAFLQMYAEKYYKVVAQQLHAVDPNHLYLGSKYANFTPEIVKACGSYCDVISFDFYNTSVSTSKWTPLLGPLTKPSIIAEFHFGSTDDGAFNGGLQQVSNQTARGTAYNNYVETVYANPLFIGAHWYQYQDQPLTGRLSDGENWGIGLTAITDRIYPELAGATSITNRNVYIPANGGRSH